MSLVTTTNIYQIGPETIKINMVNTSMFLIAHRNKQYWISYERDSNYLYVCLDPANKIYLSTSCHDHKGTGWYPDHPSALQVMERFIEDKDAIVAVYEQALSFRSSDLGAKVT